MTIDYSTIHLCNALLNASYGIMFLALWVHRRGSHLLYFGTSLMLVAGAVYGFSLTRSSIAISALLALISLNISLTWAGARVLDGKTAFGWKQLVAPVITFAGHFALVSIGQKPLADNFATALLACNVLAASLYFLRHRDGYAWRLAGWVLCAYVPLYLTAIVLDVLYPATRASSATILVGDFVLNNAFVLGLFGIMEERAREGLRKAAITDQMTGVLNRAGMLGRFPNGRILGAKTLLLADLDHFKGINDTHGHAGGDAAIREFVSRVREFLQPGECIGRLGGEEFGILLSTADRDVASRRADQIRERVAAAPVGWNGSFIPLTASFGLAVEERADTFEAILSRADDALYRAKRAGRNRVAV